MILTTVRNFLRRLMASKVKRRVVNHRHCSWWRVLGKAAEPELRGGKHYSNHHVEPAHLLLHFIAILRSVMCYES